MVDTEKKVLIKNIETNLYISDTPGYLDASILVLSPNPRTLIIRKDSRNGVNILSGNSNLIMRKKIESNEIEWAFRSVKTREKNFRILDTTKGSYFFYGDYPLVVDRETGFLTVSQKSLTNCIQDEDFVTFEVTNEEVETSVETMIEMWKRKKRKTNYFKVSLPILFLIVFPVFVYFLYYY